MKKGYKIALIAGGVLMLAGMVIGGTASLMGGNRQLKDLVVVKNSTIDLEDVSNIAQHVRHRLDFFGTDDIEIAELDELYDVDDDDWERGSFTSLENLKQADTIKRVVIDMNSDGIIVETSDEGWGYENMDGKCDISVYVEDGDTLYITGKGKVNWKHDNRHNHTLYMPGGISLDELSIKAGGGDCNLENITIREIDVDAGAMTFAGRNVTADEVEFDVGAGTVELYDVDFGKTELSAGAGTVYAKGAFRRELSADCAMGAVEIVAKGKESDYNYELDCAMGDISIDGKSYSGLSKKKVIDNGAPSTFELDCAMGTISVSFTE